MKTYSFIIFLFLLISCGKDNKSGGHNANIPGLNAFSSDAEITNVQTTMNGVMVQGSHANFAIPVPRVRDYRYSKNMIAVSYEDRGTRVRLYNALGQQLVDGSTVMPNPIILVGDDVSAIEYVDNNGPGRIVAVNAAGRVLINYLSADMIRAKVGQSVVAVTYKKSGIERALAIRANGQSLVNDDRNYVDPRFTIDPYVLIFRHSQGIQQIPL